MHFYGGISIIKTSLIKAGEGDIPYYSTAAQESFLVAATSTKASRETYFKKTAKNLI